MKKDDRPWPNYEGIKVGHLVDKADLKPWQPIRAQRKLLERYEELVNARNAFHPTQAAA